MPLSLVSLRRGGRSRNVGMMVVPAPFVLVRPHGQHRRPARSAPSRKTGCGKRRGGARVTPPTGRLPISPPVQGWCGDARNPRERRDTHIEIRGPAVDGIAAAFAQNWAECHDELFDIRDQFTSCRPQGNAVVQVVHGSAGFGWLWQDMQTLIRVIVEWEEERLRLATAYFSPDSYFIGLLCAAARRGVEAEILLPGPHTDERVCQLAGQHLYEDLLTCGIKIYQYQPADHDAREDHHRGPHGSPRRVDQLQPALPRPPRGSHARRAGRRFHRDPRRAFLRGHRCQ